MARYVYTIENPQYPIHAFSTAEKAVEEVKNTTRENATFFYGSENYNVPLSSYPTVELVKLLKKRKFLQIDPKMGNDVETIWISQTPVY